VKKEPGVEGFVAGGAELVRASEGYRKKMREIRLEVIGRYSREYASSSWWRKSVVLIKIEWEIARERMRMDPSRALYASERKQK